ncbi:hypothetical protein ACFE04_004819 [Oxalis oulophora]
MKLGIVAAIYAARSFEFISARLTTTTTTSTHVLFSTKAFLSSQPELANENISLLAPAEKNKPALNSKKLKAISRVCEIDPAGKLRPQTLYLIQGLGMELDQIKLMVRKFPQFSYCSLEGKIRPFVDFLLHLGVLKSNIPSILFRQPQLCGFRLSDTLIPTMTFLEGLGIDKAQWPKVIHRSPALLTHSRQKIQSTVNFFTEMGISEQNIGKILTRFPAIISSSVEDTLRPNVEYFRSLGSVDIASLLYRCPQVLCLSMESNLKPVTNFFLDKGYSIEEIGTLVSKFGPLYGLGLVQSLIPKWEFFLTMDYPKSELVKFPPYFGYSLEQRIKPRYAVMKESGTKLALSKLLSTTHTNFDKALKSKIAKMHSNKASEKSQGRAKQ